MQLEFRAVAPRRIKVGDGGSSVCLYSGARDHGDAMWGWATGHVQKDKRERTNGQRRVKG